MRREQNKKRQQREKRKKKSRRWICGMFLLGWQIKLWFEIPKRFSTLYFHLMLDAIGRNDFFLSSLHSVSPLCHAGISFARDFFFFVFYSVSFEFKSIQLAHIPYTSCNGDEVQFYLCLMRHTVIHRGHNNEWTVSATLTILRINYVSQRIFQWNRLSSESVVKLRPDFHSSKKKLLLFAVMWPCAFSWFIIRNAIFGFTQFDRHLFRFNSLILLTHSLRTSHQFWLLVNSTTSLHSYIL